mgnify:CR=1 FL=1
MRSLAERHNGDRWPETTFDEDRMYSPGYNATLGTTELIRLAEQFGGLSVDNPLPMVIAGYNGGADSVIRWVDLRAKNSLSNPIISSPRPGVCTPGSIQQRRKL